MKTPPRGLILGGVEVQMLTASRKSGRLAKRDTTPPPKPKTTDLPSVLRQYIGPKRDQSHKTSLFRALLTQLHPGGYGILEPKGDGGGKTSAGDLSTVADRIRTGKGFEFV